MHYNFLADLVVLIHLAFIVFAVLGGILTYWWRKALWLHIPVVLWAGWIEFTGGICPLTPLENWLRSRGEQVTYSIDFVGQYILPLVYPEGLTRGIQLVLGAIVVFVNILIYVFIFKIRKTQQRK
ncbi:MAG: DUF2784 domain-containing protein [Desulfobacterales bacterium]|nr:MAG: DUF2784 domain-containing protein [Desulfobacterales bacterium]